MKSLLGGEKIFIFTKEPTSFGPYDGVGDLHLSGNLVVTGNLTAQQSSHVYLRGPITSSRLLVNGAMTGSWLWIRSGSGGFEEGDIRTHNGEMGTLIVDTAITASNVWIKGSLRIGEGREIIVNESGETYSELKSRLEKLEKAFIEHINSHKT